MSTPTFTPTLTPTLTIGLSQAFTTLMIIIGIAAVFSQLGELSPRCSHIRPRPSSDCVLMSSTSLPLTSGEALNTLMAPAHRLTHKIHLLVDVVLPPLMYGATLTLTLTPVFPPLMHPHAVTLTCTPTQVRH